VEVRAVMQPDDRLDVPIVQIEACGIASECGVGDRVACPIQLRFGRCRHGQLRRQTNLDHDRLRYGLLPVRAHREARRVDALFGIDLRRIFLDAGSPVAELPVVGQRVAVRVTAARAREMHGERLDTLGDVG
jgi:hypothetical protein